MNLFLKYIALYLVFILIFGCSASNLKDDAKYEDEYLTDILESNYNCNSTCLEGTLVDTVGGKYPIVGARVSTIPSVDMIVETDDNGKFLIDSDLFSEDMKYNISIQKPGYIANSPSNLKVRMDTIMNLYEIVLTKMPNISLKIDSIDIKQGGGNFTPNSD